MTYSEQQLHCLSHRLRTCFRLKYTNVFPPAYTSCRSAQKCRKGSINNCIGHGVYTTAARFRQTGTANRNGPSRRVVVPREQT